MRTTTINGDLWRVIRVPAGDPSLIDRTGTERLATTDPKARTIHVSLEVQAPLLDRVILHEVAHAVTISWGLLPRLRQMVTNGATIEVEEWAARLIENHSIEALEAAREVLGRPVCVRGGCVD